MSKAFSVIAKYNSAEHGEIVRKIHHSTGDQRLVTKDNLILYELPEDAEEMELSGEGIRREGE